jgi:hypothetical protein
MTRPKPGLPGWALVSAYRPCEVTLTAPVWTDIPNSSPHGDSQSEPLAGSIGAQECPPERASRADDRGNRSAPAGVGRCRNRRYPWPSRPSTRLHGPSRRHPVPLRWSAPKTHDDYPSSQRPTVFTTTRIGSVRPSSLGVLSASSPVSCPALARFRRRVCLQQRYLTPNASSVCS